MSLSHTLAVFEALDSPRAPGALYGDMRRLQGAGR
jgi:hypothetical protein